MIKSETYKPTPEIGDLRKAIEKLLSINENTLYLGQTSDREEDIYHISNTTTFVGSSYISFVGSSAEERRNIKEILEQKLSAKYKLPIKLRSL